ncbi:hypothetical protein [Micromonospora narathiwatensis]|uniref:Clumping factor A n=1 Tax=Micromonospora narathiwatensis TaxID=299146 RepID=A0A1A8ZW99_9ACTN|nr:hypothetical protein [Micromonospora narathiwatensis]SBT48192.1 hypothetical protein GA0070621_3104 [Micromonospora narathiwatensis]
MIFASVLLILVAVVLLVVGLANGSSPLLTTSIAASLLAAVALVAAARQAAANRATADRVTGPRSRTEPAGTPYVARPGEPEIPVQHIPSTVGAGGSGWRQPPGSPVADPNEPSATDPYAPPGQREPSDGVGDDPAPTSPGGGEPFDDEPTPQHVSPADLVRLARLDDAVRVVDGHPRFHLPECPHLLGRDDEALPVAEAVGLGFTPCARCAPATVLLADAEPA